MKPAARDQNLRRHFKNTLYLKRMKKEEINKFVGLEFSTNVL
jgi:hypothetical protein